MRAWSRNRRAAGARIGFVPTMGALHEGHLRLVDRAREHSDSVVMSVFVNPLQFGPGEDFERYPRALEQDRGLAAGRDVDCLFVPEAAAMYPAPAEVRIIPGELAAHLCGPWRPGHFEGVLTVVAKLFHLVEPDVAVFGRKDAQQAVLIRQMVQTLNLPVTIVVAPIVREPDGLALSSRNAYLKPAERRAATLLSKALGAAHGAFGAGTTDPAALVDTAHRVLVTDPAIRPEYVEAVHPESLQPVAVAGGDTLLAVAVRLGTTRLIDNIILGQGVAVDELLSAPAASQR
jgi:pantoate--beta-alanine ligase